MKLRMKLSCGLSQYLYGNHKFTPSTRNRPAAVCDVLDARVVEKLLGTGWFEVVKDEAVVQAPVIIEKKPVKAFVKPAVVTEENPPDLTPEEQEAIDAEGREGGFDMSEETEEEPQQSQAIDVSRMPAVVAKLGTLTIGKLRGLKRDQLVDVAKAYGVPVTDESTKGALTKAILAKVEK